MPGKAQLGVSKMVVDLCLNDMDDFENTCLLEIEDVLADGKTYKFFQSTIEYEGHIFVLLGDEFKVGPTGTRSFWQVRALVGHYVPMLLEDGTDTGREISAPIYHDDNAKIRAANRTVAHRKITFDPFAVKAEPLVVKFNPVAVKE